jgi:hypothetical protein
VREINKDFLANALDFVEWKVVIFYDPGRSGEGIRQADRFFPDIYGSIFNCFPQAGLVLLGVNLNSEIIEPS